MFAHTSTAVTLSFCIAIGVTTLSATATAGGTKRTAIEWISISQTSGVARVKPIRGIFAKAACQTTNFMVIPLSDPLLKIKLATLYSATTTSNAVVRLIGTGDCTSSPGAETIADIIVYPPTR